MTPGGGDLVLLRRGGEYVIRVDGHDLMGSSSHSSEERLAEHGCRHIEGLAEARVLVGGLGMGYTLRAALDRLAPGAQVDVAEFSDAVVRWNRGPLAGLARSPLEDPRVQVFEEDVARVLERARGCYDAILLDVDNGPTALTASANARLYLAQGLRLLRRALQPGGVLAIWSASEAPRFTTRLSDAGFDCRVERLRARGHRGGWHFLWLARVWADGTSEGRALTPS